MPFPTLAVSFILCFSASSAASSPKAAAPAWAFRGILAGEEIPAVFLALNDGMSLAYDERGGSLLLAWKGKPVPEAPSAGPSPAGTLPRYRASGPVYHRRSASAPWSVGGPKGNIPVSISLQGVSAEGDLAAVTWRLSLPGKRIVTVKEVPMFDDHYGDPGVFRNFSVTGLPQGTSLRLSLAGRGMPVTWGGGGEGGLAGEGDSLAFVQGRDGETPLKATWSPEAAVAPAAQ
jgi:hypothetical protein